ncbi:MAG: hypothetical protein K0R26_2446 [Bacteroidota bacterium]|jgi:hypothetical protein|nr:hypothetical protein [Bacteroidota bacterium]
MKLSTTLRAEDLKVQFSKNKIIPAHYEKPILIALSHYPELKNTAIEFQLHKRLRWPVKTEAILSNVFIPRAKKVFKIYIRESEQPELILKNMSTEAQIGAVARELALIQFCKRNRMMALINDTLDRIHLKKNIRIEMALDNSVIKHGLSTQLAEYVKALSMHPSRNHPVHEPYLTPTKITALNNQKLGI